MLTIDNLLAIYPTLKRDRAMAYLSFRTDALREAQATSKLSSVPARGVLDARIAHGILAVVRAVAPRAAVGITDVALWAVRFIVVVDLALSTALLALARLLIPLQLVLDHAHAASWLEV